MPTTSETSDFAPSEKAADSEREEWARSEARRIAEGAYESVYADALNRLLAGAEAIRFTTITIWERGD
jgi:hypothetical protein